MMDNAWPDWARDGYPHLWLPYAQMQTQTNPEAAVRASGVRIELADEFNSCRFRVDSRVINFVHDAGVRYPSTIVLKRP